jgi:hypothetical protein
MENQRFKLPFMISTLPIMIPSLTFCYAFEFMFMLAITLSLFIKTVRQTLKDSSPYPSYLRFLLPPSPLYLLPLPMAAAVC